MDTKLNMEKCKMQEIAMSLKKSVEQSEIRRACYCLPLRGTILTWGYLKLFLVFLFGVVAMNWASFVFFISSTVDSSFYQLLILLICLGLELVFTNALIIGVHTGNMRVLRVYMYFLTVNIMFLLGLFVGLIVIPLGDVLKDHTPYMYSYEFWFWLTIATLIYLGLNIYVMVLIRSEVCRLRGDISYEQLNDDPVTTGVIPPNSDNYFLVTKLNPNSKNGPPQFLVKKYGKVTISPV